MEKYFVYHDGEQLGPWAAADILQKLNSNQLEWTDYIFDSSKNDWVVILEMKTFSKHLPVAQTKMDPSSMDTSPLVNPSGDRKSFVIQNTDEIEESLEWFVLKGDNRYGPFSYIDLLKMLQARKLFEHDYVWNQKLTGWARVAEIGDFSHDRIKSLKESGQVKVTEAFFRRRHARIQYGTSLIVHNKKDVWKAHSLEISAGGAGLIIPTDDLKIDQSLFLHFKAGDGVPPFNAICAIVSKRPFKGDQCKYGVKFTSISQSVQLAIKRFADKLAKDKTAA